ncbi:hypothetical protein M798_10820 [Brucella melitensis ADMAS-G1]|nr:hypothetical protein M798_10820 [Brucella melitensis ADMAS-G1]
MALLTLSTTRLTLRCKAKRRLEGEVQMELETHRWSTAPSFLRPPILQDGPAGLLRMRIEKTKTPPKRGLSIA